MENMKKKPLSLRVAASLAPALVGIPSMLTATTAMANDDDPIMLDTLQIEERTVDTNPYAEDGAPYKAKTSGDRRHLKPLADTPQTITVLTQTQIQDSGKSDIKDILAAQPGITLGTGENGNAFGDRYVIRGHEARSDVFVDGLRDTGMTTRESFAVEQVEVTKGPSSTFAGRGSTGGAVNSITKQASTEYSFNKISAGVGTDSYRRATVDSNLALTDTIAVRANLLHAYEEVPDREPADRERNGAAVSASIQATDELKIIADYYHLSAFDHADLGAYIDRSTGKVNEDVPSYVQDEDFLKSRVDTWTLRGEYETDNVTITNAIRHGTTNNGYFVTGAGSTSAYDAASADDVDDSTSTYSSISLSNHTGWQEVEYFVDQLNVYFDAELGGMEHQFVTGLEYSKHDVLNGSYSDSPSGATNCIVSGRGGVSGGYCLIDANGNEVDDINSLIGRNISKGSWDSNYQITTWSFYLMDTIEVNDQLDVFAGIRADQFDYSNVVMGWGSSTPSRYEYDDTLWNGHLGMTVEFLDNANFYATWSTSSNINGGESDVGGSCGYGGLCGDADIVGGSKPEDTANYEMGFKVELNDEKLLATLAMFQVEKKNVMEEDRDSTGYTSAGQLNTGANRVKGIELGLTGNLTDNLSTQAGYTHMISEVTDSYDESNIGGRLANFSDNSAYVMLNYALDDSLSVGGAMTYASESYVGQPDSPAGDLYVPAYRIFDLFATYEFSEQLKARLNVGNVADTKYYLTAYRSGTFAYIGDARNSQLTIEYEF